MTETATEWTLEGFVSHFDFVHHKMLDHKYVWMLGAGASFSSGIPLGSQLVDQWLQEMQVREDRDNTLFKDWATSESLGIKGFNFDERASFYTRIYERRFQGYPDEGYAYLESVMSGKDPSPGYSILATALAADPPRHNVVITTNFDNLVADALAIYTDTFPFVAGHESLTGFVRVSMRRPLICKVHRDLLLGPQNDARSLKRLHDAWGTALRALFQHYTPLFIGYGGNDDTLMDLLESMQPSDIKGELMWCYYEKQTPSERIQNAVSNLRGVLVPVPDFDLLMVLLGEKMGISTLDEEIGRRAEVRTQRYRDRIQHLDTVEYPAVAKALAATFERSGGWWAWHQKALLESDLDRREIVYKQAIQLSPKSAQLKAVFAAFMWDERHDAAAAEPLMRQAVELGPTDATILNNWASFLWHAKSDYEKAAEVYRETLKLEENSNVVGNYASLLSIRLGKDEEADLLFQRSIELAPNDPYAYGRYSKFLLTSGRLSEASLNLQIGRSLITSADVVLDAGFAFLSAILARAKGIDDASDILIIKNAFSNGYRPGLTDMSQLLEYVRRTLSTNDHTFFVALSEGLRKPLKTIDIDQLLKARGSLKRKRKQAKSPVKSA